MTPTGSWPRTRPGLTGYSPRTMCTSVPQMVVVVIRMTASPARGLGFATSSTAMRSLPRKTTAFIVFMRWLPQRDQHEPRRADWCDCADPSLTGDGDPSPGRRTSGWHGMAFGVAGELVFGEHATVFESGVGPRRDGERRDGFSPCRDAVERRDFFFGSAPQIEEADGRTRLAARHLRVVMNEHDRALHDRSPDQRG